MSLAGLAKPLTIGFLLLDISTASNYWFHGQYKENMRARASEANVCSSEREDYLNSASMYGDRLLDAGYNLFPFAHLMNSVDEPMFNPFIATEVLRKIEALKKAQTRNAPVIWVDLEKLNYIRSKGMNLG